MYVGVDIGGTKTLVASLDVHGVIIEQQRFATPRAYPNFLKELTDCVAKLSTKTFLAGGVGVPGRIDRQHGVSGVGEAFGNLPWKNVPIRHDVANITKCPIVIENDANLAGLSEAMLLKRDYDKVLYITISTGIGTGVIVNQQIDPAFADSEGGYLELSYHGKLMPWQRFASGSAIFKRYGRRAADITDSAIWQRIAHDIAVGLNNLIAIIQPEIVVLGGGVSNYYQRFKDPLQKELQQYATPLTPLPPITEAQRPDEAVIYGCYDLAKATYGKHR